MFSGFLSNLIEENTLFNEKETETTNRGLNIENLTINTILTVLNIIYLMFSFIQITNLFGKLESSTNFNYAEYARQGFFQLMFVSIINLIILFIANTNKKEATTSSKRYKKIMSIIIILFTIIIIISAFYRMNLYEKEYGYTYLRVFVYFTLATELILTIPIILYLLEMNIDLVKISIIVVTTMYVILNFVNIDNMIAKKNIDRYIESSEEKELDISYLIQNTGTDAIPQITRLLKVEDRQLAEKAERYLYKEKESLEKETTQWQERNYSKEQAKKILKNIFIGDILEYKKD